MLRTATVLTLLAALAACESSKAATDVPKDVESRLARLEKRVDKIIEVLEPRVGSGEPDPEAVYAVPIDPLDPVEGPADAKVTIVEGFEFACPYCLQANGVVEQLKAEFPNDVRIVNKYLVVHGEAIPSGLAVCAANQQGKFVEMKNLIWSKAWGPDGRPVMEELGPEAMERNAQALGLDVEKFKADMTGAACRGWLEKSEATLRAVGQTGTPGFYVNGRALGGYLPLDRMRPIVQEELKKAEAAIAGGVPQKDFYQQEVVAKGEKKVKGLFDIE